MSTTIQGTMPTVQNRRLGNVLGNLFGGSKATVKKADLVGQTEIEKQAAKEKKVAAFYENQINARLTEIDATRKSEIVSERFNTERNVRKTFDLKGLDPVESATRATLDEVQDIFVDRMLRVTAAERELANAQIKYEEMSPWRSAL